MSKYYVFYDNPVMSKLIKNVKRVDNYLLFRIGKQKHVAMISSKPRSFPIFLGVKELYFVFENDTNTFDIESGSILDEKLDESWRKYLLEHPENRHLTKEAKKPEDMEKHHIIEDIQHIVLDGQFLKNLLNKIKGIQLMDWLFPFVAGMGASIVMLMVLGSLSPQNLYIRIGHP